jgi:hypothetical protein
MPRGWIAQPPMVDRVDEFMSSAEILAGGQCCAGGSATPAPRAEPLGIERCGLRARGSDAPTGKRSVGRVPA